MVAQKQGMAPNVQSSIPDFLAWGAMIMCTDALMSIIDVMRPGPDIR